MKPIPGFPEYFADKQGNIFSRRRNGRGNTDTNKFHKLKACLTGKNGQMYHSVTLSINGKHFHFRRCRLILLTFVGVCPEGMECCHGPAGRLDDSLANLCWGTREKNQGPDRRRDGTANTHNNYPVLRGEDNPSHKLTEKDVRYIRENYMFYAKDGLNGRKLATMFNVTPTMISDIIRRKNWNHI